MAREGVSQPRIREHDGSSLRLEVDGIRCRCCQRHIFLWQIQLHLARLGVVEQDERAILGDVDEVEADDLRPIAMHMLLHCGVLVMLLTPELREVGAEVLHGVALAIQNVPRYLRDEVGKIKHPGVAIEIARHQQGVNLVELFDFFLLDGERLAYHFPSGFKELRRFDTVDHGWKVQECLQLCLYGNFLHRHYDLINFTRLAHHISPYDVRWLWRRVCNP